MSWTGTRPAGAPPTCAPSIGPPEPDPILALRAGDPAPFEQFVRAHSRSLVALFRRRGASLARAEDLTQEVFLKLCESTHQYEPRERFQAFCFRVARNVWVDECRRIAVRSGAHPEPLRLHEAELAGATVEPHAALSLDEEQRGLESLLLALAPAHRRVFELVLIAGLTYSEIAAQLSIPVGTVKSRMFHAVRRLRRAWQERCRTEGVA